MSSTEALPSTRFRDFRPDDDEIDEDTLRAALELFRESTDLIAEEAETVQDSSPPGDRTVDKAGFRELIREPSVPLPAGLDWWARDAGEDLPETRPMPVVEDYDDSRMRRSRLTLFYSDAATVPGMVFHISPESDVLVKTAFGSVEPAEGIVPQQLTRVEGSDLVLSLRMLVDRTLADDLGALDSQKPSQEGLSQRIEVLRMVLVGLESLHRQKLVHGDLRPENVIRGEDGKARLVDYSIRPPLELLTPEQRVYVAPEARESKTLPASDIYAFGKLAQRLLGAYLWDSRYLPRSLDTDAFEWILDYCTLDDPAERPDIETLRAVLFGEGLDKVEGLALRATVEARRKAIDRLESNSAWDRKRIESVVEAASAQVRELVEDKPETLLAIRTPKKALALIERFIIDSGLINPHNMLPEDPAPGQSEIAVEHLENPKPEIDMQWKDRLHRLHFGFGITLDHDARLPKVRKGSQKDRERLEYLRHVADVSEARANILSKDVYLHTAGVARLLSQAGTAVSGAEVAVLRRWGHILAVPDHGRWLYPNFQFDTTTFSTPPLIEQVNDRLGESSPWEILSWWHLPRPSLEGESLASIVHTPAGAEAVEQALARIRPAA